MTIRETCDVAVIGGGPAGSTVASYLSSRGYHVVLLERAQHPRFTVGESLLPHCWRFFDLLGVTPAIEREGFVAKQGGTVVWDGRVRQLSFSDFGFRRPGLHVERDRLDLLLLDHARLQGTSVHENFAVKEIQLGGSRGPRLRYSGPDPGDEGTLGCRFVVDASGQSAVLSRQLGMRQIDEDFRFVSLWGYFEGSKYVAADGCAHPFTDIPSVPPTTFVGSLGNWGWAWHIPMRQVTSVGLVIPLGDFKAAKQGDDRLEAYFLKTLQDVPYLGRLLDRATLVPGGFHVIRDYSYVPGQVAGPGYFIVGDAAAFVDPVFSLGVVLAMYSGQLAGWAIDRSLRDPSRTENSRDIFTRQFQGRYELARTMAIPGRPLTAGQRQTAREFLKFQSNDEQELMYTAAMLTTRSENFMSISDLRDGATPRQGKYRELDAIAF